LEVAAYSGTFDKYRDLLTKDTVLIAEGGLSIDEYTNSLRLTAEKLYSMDQAREMYARGIMLSLKNTDKQTDNAFIAGLGEVLKPFCGGQCPISIDYTNATAKTMLQLDDNWRVHPSDELLIRLRRFLSADAVQVRYKA
jgi:DNA polymerase-3 subunit alpha